MKKTGGSLSLPLIIVVLLIVVVGGYYVMQGSKSADTGTQSVVSDESDVSAMTKLEADASLDTGADDLDASLDGLDSELGI